MSATAQIRIDLDANKANRELEKLNKTGKDTNKTFKSVDATFEEVYGDLKPLTARMGEAEDRLYELALAGKKATAEYQALLVTVGNYRKTQIQTDLAVDSAAMTITQKLTTGIGAAAGGFAIAEGAMAAFGAESESLTLMLQRVAGAMAILQGLNELRESAPVLQQMFSGLTNASSGAEAVGEAMQSATSHTSDYVAAAADVGAAVTDVATATTNANTVQKAMNVTTQAGTVALTEQQIAQYQLLAGQREAVKQRVYADLAEQKAILTKEEYSIVVRQTLKDEYARNGILLEGIELQNLNAVATGRAVVATEAQATATEAAALATEQLTIAQKAQAIASKVSVGGWLLIATAIAAAGYAIYEYVKSAEAEEKYRKRIAREREYAAEQLKKEREAVYSASAEYVGLIQALKQTNAGSKERADLIKEINANYGTTLKNIQDETLFQQQLNAEVLNYIAYQKARYQVEKNQELIQKNLEKQDELTKNLKTSRAQLLALENQIRNLPPDALEAGKLLQDQLDLNKTINKTQSELDAANKRLEGYGLNILNAKESVNDLSDAGKKYNTSTNNKVVTEKELSDLEKFEERLKSIGAVFKGIGEDDPTAAFGYLDTLGPKILEAETDILKQQLNIRGTYGNERLALEEELRKAELALNDLYLEQELAQVGKSEEEKNKIRAEYALKRDDILRKSSLQVTDVEAEQAEKVKDWEQWTLNERLEMYQEFADKIAEIVGQATDVISQFQENQAATQQSLLDSQYEQQQLALEGSLENRLISQEQYDAEVKAMEQARREEQKVLDREIFDRNKKIQIANATISTAQAVLSGFQAGLSAGAAIPLPGAAVALAGIYAGIAGAFGAAQIAMIANQPFTAARGGIVPGNGSGRYDTVDARLAPGEAVINAQSTQAFLPVLNAINQMGGGQPLVATQTSQVTQIAGYNQQPIVKAYVVERDITEAQTRTARVRRNAKLFRK